METLPIVCDCDRNPNCRTCGGLGYFKVSEQVHALLTMPEKEYRAFIRKRAPANLSVDRSEK